MMKSFALKIFYFFSCCIIMASLLISCSNDENPLAPYTGSPNLSEINIEQNSFEPAVTWVGGYASVFGVNKGSKAVLDSTLIWLVYASGNQIKYPVEFGELPQGAQDLTQQYGGTKVNTLSEDNTYTFWVMKEEAWDRVKNSNAELVFDSTSTAIIETTDSIKITQKLFTSRTLPLDVFINVYGISTFGRLADISISSDLSNAPVVSWNIKQDGVTDTKLSAIGITEGGQFTPTNTIWEVYSVSELNGTTAYGKINVIPGPVKMGTSFEHTQVFYEFPEEGLERNKTYYLWIANETWDGANRLRFANGYAYATFSTK